MFTTSFVSDSASGVSNLAKALFDAQDEFPPVFKENKNPRFSSKYADLETVVTTLQPILRKHKLMIIQPCYSDYAGDIAGVTTTLIHVPSGEYIAESFGLPSNTIGKDNTLGPKSAQSAVAAVTYARRVGYLSILGIVPEDEDDDGNTATPVRTQTVHPLVPTSEVVSRKPGRPKKEPNVVKANEVMQNLPPAKGESVPLKAEPVHADSPLSETERKKYTTRAHVLVDKLREAGLQSNGTIMPGKRLGNLILKKAQKTKVEELTKIDWDSFFTKVDAVLADGGYAKMIQIIEESEKI